MILETDGKALASRVLMKGSTGDTPLSELTLSRLFPPQGTDSAIVAILVACRKFTVKHVHLDGF